MEKLNIYVNKLTGSYAGGLLVVAAHNIEEADKVCMNEPKLEGKYWCRENGKTIHEYMEGYRENTFEQIPNAYYEGEPRMLAEDSYVE